MNIIPEYHTIENWILAVQICKQDVPEEWRLSFWEELKKTNIESSNIEFNGQNIRVMGRKKLTGDDIVKWIEGFIYESNKEWVKFCISRLKNNNIVTSFSENPCTVKHQPCFSDKNISKLAKHLEIPVSGLSRNMSAFMIGLCDEDFLKEKKAVETISLGSETKWYKVEDVGKFTKYFVVTTQDESEKIKLNIVNNLKILSSDKPFLLSTGKGSMAKAYIARQTYVTNNKFDKRYTEQVLEQFRDTEKTLAIRKIFSTTPQTNLYTNSLKILYPQPWFVEGKKKEATDTIVKEWIHKGNIKKVLLRTGADILGYSRNIAVLPIGEGDANYPNDVLKNSSYFPYLVVYVPK
jgi:hypothetical protein